VLCAAAGDNMDVSLIICTRNRSQQLARCLDSLRRITSGIDWELIIVDNGSIDETPDVARKFIRTASVPTHYVLEPKPGLANGHNAGVAVAHGEILAFTDDDCYPAPDFPDRVRSAFEDPSVGFITGRIVLHDPADHPITTNESVIPLTFDARSYIRGGAVQGANMAFRRRVLLDIGGFDPLFGPGSVFNAEDLDAASRASLRGWKGRYCPEVVVRHHHGRKASDAAPLLKSYWIGRGAYHMKLLLKSHRFLWFARGIYGAFRRWRPHGLPVHEATFWQGVGGAQYAYVYIRQRFRSRTGSQKWDPGRQ
jgi:GT2 family glycosyltransferase